MIDEKKLINYIKAEINPYGKPFNDTAYEFGLKLIDYIEAMEKQPQAGYGAGKWMGSVCSCCGESVSEWYNFKFCPMCGAKMEDYEE